MKKALFLALICLSACSQAPSLTPEQEAVAAYVKQNANDPASYAPVRWGKADVWRQQDADRLSIDTLEIKHTAAKQEADRLALKWAASKAKGHSTATSWKELLSDADTVQMRLYTQIVKAHNSTDTTRLGTVVPHTFRMKNKLGALVLDSARFIVSKTGKVSVI